MRNEGTVLITGSTDGIGLQVARKLLNQFDRVIIHGKDENKCAKIVNEYKCQKDNGKIEYICFDLSRVSEINKGIDNLSSRYKDLNTIVNNAGIFKKKYSICNYGLETMFMVNHFSQFYMVKRLLENKDLVIRRIVNTGSLAHLHVKFPDDNLNNISSKNFNSYKVYSLTKLYCLMHSKMTLQEKIVINCYDPGFVNTKLMKAGWKIPANDNMENAIRTVQNIVEGKYSPGEYVCAASSDAAVSNAVTLNNIKELEAYDNRLYERIRHGR